MAKVAPDSLGAMDAKKKSSAALSTASIELAIDPHKRRVATMTIIAAAFVDLACSVILQPSHPMMASNAPKAVKPEAWPDGYSHPQAFPRDGMPEYQWAISFMLVANQVGQAISQLLFGVLSDRIGRKPCMLICLAMGAVTMALYYVSGVVIRSYWAYVGFQFLNGLFGATKGLSQNYIQDINEPQDFKSLQPLIITAFTFGGVGGGLLGGVMNGAMRVDDISGDLFAAALVGVVGEALCFFAVLFFCPREPPKQQIQPPGQAATSAGPAAKAKSAVESNVWNILLVLVIAGGFDAFGDNGNTFARNVIFSNRYPAGKEPTWNTILLVLKCIGVFFAMMIVVKSAKCIKMPLWTIIGNLFSSFCQYGVIPNALPMGAFVPIWTTSQCFGFTSTMANMFLLPAYAPPASRGFWLGLNSSVLMASMAGAPVVLSLVYSLLLPPEGSPVSEYAEAEMACLLLCGSISLLAAVLYTPLLCLIPKAAAPAPFQASKEDIDKYRQMTPKEFTRLPGPMRYAVNKLLIEEGQEPLHAHWIPYAEDLEDDELVKLSGRASLDFKFIEKELYTKLKSREGLAEEVDALPARRELMNAGYDVARERATMGAWLADYLDDAGYHSWMWFPDTYKAMVMNAFPPMIQLNNKKVDFETVDDYEAYLLRFNGIMKRHVAMNARSETAEAMKNMAAKQH